MIEHNRKRYEVARMCEFFEVSRAAYYAWRKKIEQPDPDEPRIRLIEEAYIASRKTYGYRRIQMWIEQNKGITINHKAVLRLMNKMGIQSVARKRKYHKKWAQNTRHHCYQNLLKRDFSADRPNQKCVTDITYIQTKQG